MDTFYRFSESPIWQIQKDYYQQLGIETWGKAMVPFTATTNSFVANGYAQTIQAFILDLERNKQLQLPINIVELGTGHGRFSFMLMKALYEIYKDYETKPFRYIMTDIAPVSIEAWRQHPKLAQYIEDGTLDFAQFDAVTQEDTPLEVSGHSFKETLTDTPLVLVANFILDVLPYDLFKISEGALSQCNVAVHLKNDITFEHPPAEVIKNIELEQQFTPCGDSYYDDNKLNKILDDYKEEIEDSVIQLPINTIKSINYFNRLSNCNLWLIAEEATTESENLDGKSSTGIKKEGSFTTRVNLHCVKKYLENTHSRFLSPDHPDPRFDSYAILNGTDAVDYTLTSNSFTQTQNLFGPRSFFRFFVSLSREKVGLSDDGILSLLELSKYDPYIVYRFHDEILNACLDSKGFKREALQLALTKTWDNYYDIGEEYKQAYYLGRMIRRLGNYQQAIKFFQLSLLEQEGESHKTHYWLGRTFLSLKNTTEAQEHFKTSIQLGEGQKNDNHTTYYWLGRSALLVDDPATAEEYFKQSLQLSRKHESSIKAVIATAS